MPEPGGLDPLIHAPVRLAAVSALIGVDHLSFIELRDVVKATDGNLATHLSKLEEAGYVAVDKQFVARRPLTTYRLTELGRLRFAAYLDALEALLPPR
jgi:DNA-binding transcriptional ArsR family regulator